MKRFIPILCALFALATYLLAAWHAPLFMDEYSFQRNVAHFVQTRSAVPVFARYPPLYSYLIAPPIYVAFIAFYWLQGLPLAGLRDVALLKFLFAEHVMIWTWVARVITMIFAAGTVLLVLRYALRKLQWGGVLAVAAMMLLDPFGLLVELSRHGLPDVPAACLVTAAVLLCLKFMESGNLRHVYLGALLVGLAGSMKVNGLLAIPAICLAPCLGVGTARGWRPVFFAFLICIVGFAAGSFSLLVSWGSFAAELRTERGILLSSGHLGAHGTPWVWVVDQLWRGNSGVAILVLFAVVVAIIRRTHEDLLFVALLIPAFVVIGALQKKTLIYFVVIYPALALWVGRLVNPVWVAMRSGRGRVVVFAALVTVFFGPAGVLFANGRVWAREDNTVLARSWIEREIPAGTPLLLDWAYVPALSDAEKIAKWVGAARAAASSHVHVIEEHYRGMPTYPVTNLLSLSYDGDAVRRSSAKYLVTSAGCYGRFFPRLPADEPGPSDPLYAEFRHRRGFYKDLFDGRTGFRLLVTFSEGSGHVVSIFRKDSGLDG